jgi:hypothetical protein
LPRTNYNSRAMSLPKNLNIMDFFIFSVDRGSFHTGYTEIGKSAHASLCLVVVIFCALTSK